MILFLKNRMVWIWLISTFLLLWVSIWNGFPIVFGDTGSYFHSAATGNVGTYRPSTYFLIVYPTLISKSLWPSVILQAFVTAYVFCRILILDFKLSLISHVLILTAVVFLTTLPWWVGTVMADLWCGIVAMALYLLLFHWSRLKVIEHLMISGLFVLGLTFHISNIPIIMTVFFSILLLNWLVNLRIEASVLQRSIILLLIVISGLFYPMSNMIKYDWGTPSSGAGLLLLARFSADGHIIDLLENKCPDISYELCDDIDILKTFINTPPPDRPRNQWPCPCSEEGYVNWILLFDKASPIRKIYHEKKGSDPGPIRLARKQSDDLNRILTDSIRFNPLGHIKSVLTGAIDLYFNSGLTPFIDGRYMARFTKGYSENEYKQSRKSRSASGTLYISTFNRFLKPMVILGTGICIASLLFFIFNAKKVERCPYIVQNFMRNAIFFFLFALSNALVMYAVVGDHTRYQSRCSWMVAMQMFFLVAITIDHFTNKWKI